MIIRFFCNSKIFQLYKQQNVHIEDEIEKNVHFILDMHKTIEGKNFPPHHSILSEKERDREELFC